MVSRRRAGAGRNPVASRGVLPCKRAGGWGLTSQDESSKRFTSLKKEQRRPPSSRANKPGRLSGNSFVIPHHETLAKSLVKKKCKGKGS